MDIRVKRQPPAALQQRRSAIYLDQQVAALLRKLCRLEGCDIDSLLLRIVRSWLSHERPDLEFVEDSVPEYERSPRRRATASMEGPTSG